MAFFRDVPLGPRDGVPPSNDAVQRTAEREPAEAPRRPIERVETRPEPRQTPRAEPKESVFGPELTLEGKIEGVGHIRIGGRFKGDINVQGNLTIEPGAQVSGAVRAQQVVIGGTLEGNIDGAERVELQQTGVLTGDLKAASLVVAAGSRMRGQVEFGWENKPGVKGSAPLGHGSG